ncbi:MAG: prepilin-type N-terminal cleavage/methylation domain-containing protein [Phycisphaerae bacterium]|nr:prepilin-type N-terminal cleavage/methylation domain-containing protein [Phycisphaerae bacterium]
MQGRSHARPAPERRAYTLIELLVVVTVLGIAATMVVPAFSQTNTLRLQAAVRLIISDMTQAQSDAVAMQSPQGVLFSLSNESSGYVIGPVTNGQIDATPGIGVSRIISGEEFGNARLASLNLAQNGVWFDALGGPVTTPGGQTPAGNMSLEVRAGTQGYVIQIEAFTGRITVATAEEEGVLIGGN